MCHFKNFLRNAISDQSLQIDQEGLSVILQWPGPQGLQAIQGFLGFASYWQFIPYFSALVALITSLIKKGVNTKNWIPQTETF